MEIVIMGQPVAKQANKITCRGQKPRQYSSQKLIETRYERDILIQCKEEDHNPFTGAIRVDYQFIAARPKSHFGTGKNSHILKPSAPAFWIVKKNDFDNMLKFLNDRCSSFVWVDDCQIIVWTGEKRYCYHNEEARTILKVWAI